VNGKVSWQQIAAGYLGVLSLGGTCVAIGTFGSAIGKNQLLAVAVTAFLIIFFLLGWLLGQVTEPPFSDFFSYIAMYDRHYQPFMRGRVNTESLVFFGGISFAFLLLATRVLQARRNQ
jgi:ABC-2 type transport system permease protein